MKNKLLKLGSIAFLSMVCLFSNATATKADTTAWNSSAYNTFCGYTDAGTPRVSYTVTAADGYSVTKHQGEWAMAGYNASTGWIDGMWIKSISINNESTGIYAGGTANINAHIHNKGWTGGVGNYVNGAVYHPYGWIEAVQLTASNNTSGDLGNYCYFQYRTRSHPVSWPYLVAAAGGDETALRANNPTAYPSWQTGQNIYKNGNSYVDFYGNMQGSVSPWADYEHFNMGINGNWAGTAGYSLPLEGIWIGLGEYPCNLYINPNGGTWAGATSTVQVGATATGTAIGAGDTVEIRHNPTRKGYTFVGWSASQVNTTASAATFNQAPANVVNAQLIFNPYNGFFRVDVGNQAAVTLTAQWVPNTLTIYYDENGGTFPSWATTYQVMNYNSAYNLSGTIPSRAGYNFMGWGTTANWTNARFGNSGTFYAQDWAKNVFDVDLGAGNHRVRLYAQWERTLHYNFKYYYGGSAGVDITFHNADSSKVITIPSEARGSNKSFNGSNDWSFRGFSEDSSPNAGIAIGSGTGSITVYANDHNRDYYASYQRNTVITYVDFADDTKKTRTSSNTSYMNWTAQTVDAGFSALTQNTMKYSETNVFGSKTKETWASRGWTISTAQNANPELYAGSYFTSNQNKTYYGLYQKGVTLSYNPNGGTVSKVNDSYIRYANAVDVANATRQEFAMPIPTWIENNVTRYIFGAWTNTQKGVNEDFSSVLVSGVRNTGNGIFRYTPLVSGTVYAAWTNKSDSTPYEPNVSISKEAVWNNPAGDNSAVDFDNLQNIDIDGIARVTIKVNISNRNNIGAKSIKVTDYFNTEMWDYYQDSTHKVNISKGSMARSGDTIIWSIPDNTTGTVTLTYYVKIKEIYWDVENSTNEYINKIPDLNSYLASLVDKSKNPGTVNNDNMYYCSSVAASKAYVWVDYKINSGMFAGTARQIHNATPYVVMRPVNWIPTLSLDYGIGIESDTNNIYKDLSSSYENTYFVKYNTKSSDSSDSTFRLYELSQIRRSYSYYQITNNLMDMRTAAKNQEVIDNYLGINNFRGNIWSNVTAEKLSLGFSAKTLIPVVSADNIRSGVTTNGFVYKTAALTSYDTVYATNQNGLKISVYPFIRTTNSKTGITYETTRDTNALKNKRIDLVIDASDPIITPPDSPDDPMRTEDEDGNEWTDSDGYMDINLVDKKTNPKPATKTLTFKFEDEVSGINSPDADTNDWINSSNQNVQITLERVDNDPIMIYDSGLIPSNQSDVVKVTYDTTSAMNKTGNVKVILDPTNDDILGHLRLTIKVIDNVSNYTVKTYDIYVFCLTGAVEISPTLPDYAQRTLELNRFANGELGFVKVSAGGYVDRTTLDFGAYLDKLYKDEYSKRQNFIADTVKTINGDYPYTDANNVGTSEDSTMTYLPYSMQVRTWGYTDDTLGGLKIKQVALNKYTQTVDNSILQEHLSDLIERYQGINQGESYAVESGSDYAIVGSILYTHPVMNGDNVISYVDMYEFGGETYYDDVLYPAYITLDGTKGITLTYKAAAPEIEETEDAEDEEKEAMDEGEDDEPKRKIVASVEDNTEIILSSWVQVGDGYLRPFMHYFYMPLEAEQKVSSAPYYVTLTSYKDSEKEIKHHVSVRLSFYNDLEAIHKHLETYIKDN